jgi:hypothetical protein
MSIATAGISKLGNDDDRIIAIGEGDIPCSGSWAIGGCTSTSSDSDGRYDEVLLLCHQTDQIHRLTAEVGSDPMTGTATTSG